MGRPLKNPNGYYAKNKERWIEYANARRTGDWTKYQQMRHESYERNKAKRLEESKRAWEKVRPKVAESSLYDRIAEEFVGYARWTLIPDFRNAETGGWLEVKLASKTKNKVFRYASKYFPGLWFQGCGSRQPRGATKPVVHQVDDQIDSYPRPLKVVVFDGYDGSKLAERSLE